MNKFKSVVLLSFLCIGSQAGFSAVLVQSENNVGVASKVSPQLMEQAKQWRKRNNLSDDGLQTMTQDGLRDDCTKQSRLYTLNKWCNDNNVVLNKDMLQEMMAAPVVKSEIHPLDQMLYYVPRIKFILNKLGLPWSNDDQLKLMTLAAFEELLNKLEAEEKVKDCSRLDCLSDSGVESATQAATWR